MTRRHELKILHINDQRTWRGGEQQTLYLARGQMNRGHDVTILCQPDSPLATIAVSQSVPIIPLKMRGELDLIAIAEIAKRINREQYHIVHMHTSHAHALGWAASITNDMILHPMKWTVSTRLAKRNPHRLSQTGNALSSRGAVRTLPRLVVSRRVDFSTRRSIASSLKYRTRIHRYIAISHAVRDVLIQDGIPPWMISVVHSGIDLQKFENVPARDYRKEFSLPPNSRPIGNVAALVDHKGHRFLLEAIPKVIRSEPRAHFFIVGDGELRDCLVYHANKLGIQNSVTFTGYRKDIPSLLRFFEIFVMSSHMEGLCTSILDAMASHIPVVATTAGGIPEIITDDVDGLLVPVRNPEALATAIIRLLEDRQLARRLATAGYHTVATRFTVDAMVDLTLEIYKEILDN